VPEGLDAEQVRASWPPAFKSRSTRRAGLRRPEIIRMHEPSNAIREGGIGRPVLGPRIHPTG